MNGFLINYCKKSANKKLPIKIHKLLVVKLFKCKYRNKIG